MRYRLEPLLNKRVTFTATVKEICRSPQRNVFRALLANVHHQREYVTDHVWIFVSRHHPFTDMIGARVVFTASVEPYLKHRWHSSSDMLIDCHLVDARDVRIISHRSEKQKGGPSYAKSCRVF